MKHLLFVIFSVACLSAKAQDSTQGKVNYVITLNLHANLKPDQLQYKEALPEFIDREIIYLFKGKHGLLKNGETPEEGEGDVDVQVKIGNEDGVTYVDMNTKKNLHLVKVGGKEYLYSGTPASADNVNLKLEEGKEEETGETKKIMGYTCKKVVSGSGKDKVTYWYTNQLPILGGAFGIMSGRGLILELESKLFSFKTKSFQFEKITDADVLPPKGLETIDKLK